jgi:hypothetical protein
VAIETAPKQNKTIDLFSQDKSGLELNAGFLPGK